MISKKPLLLIFYQYDPWTSSIGGIQSVINNFIKYSPEDFDLGVVGITGDRETTLGIWQEKDYQGRSVKFLPVAYIPDDDVRQLIPTTLQYAFGLFRYRNLAKHADFMHFHRIEPSIVSLGLRAKKVLFVHNDIQQQMFGSDKADSILWRSLPQAYFFIENILISQFDTILSCNSQSLSFYKSKYPDLASRIDIVKNTVDVDIFSYADFLTKESLRQSLAEELNLAQDSQFIFFAGRFHPQKDPLLLLRSMACLRDNSVHLLLAGAGELEASMRAEVVRLNLSEQVTFLGRLSPSQMAKMHQASSAFILTSIYEGLPMVALEALACGTPVITTNCGETPHLISSSSGIVLPNREASSIARSIEAILENRHRFPPEDCVRSSQPFRAENVIGEIYETMRLSADRNLEN